MAANEPLVEPRAKDIPLLHVHFGGREDLLAWFEKDAEEAGMTPEERVIWIIETYREAVEEL